MEIVRKKYLLLVACAASLAGCASTKDIDLSKVETVCGQTCAGNYSSCLRTFTMFPIQRQHECTDALRLCAQACPPRSVTESTSESPRIP